ncbi:MAG: isoleucine--tRNA ligase [Saprospiraceae bacterium]|nr:isoleucine--tRNA ligase [Saprospiraceae bacterium]
MRYKEIKSLHLPDIDKEILQFWKDNNIFEKSITSRKGKESFVFYEGPPSANGKPGIHHVMSRTVKDIFCRYQTLKGKKVTRKGGWDTHGLPIELSVEKELGINKEDIGVKISIEEYNQKCKETVMRFKNEWDDMTVRMGYWVDLNDPYITFENNYIESVWNLLKRIYDKGLLYKGFTIQPFSPAAGTGLSSHELNMPGAYREVKDVSAVVLFEIDKKSISEKNQALSQFSNIRISAWTTTPWTLPSNTALTVGEKIEYSVIDTFNPYTKERVKIIMAKELISKWFKPENEIKEGEIVIEDEKKIPYKVLDLTILGKKLEGLTYHPLFNYDRPIDGDAFRVLVGDFVSTEDGTGVVHTAPSFGSDDMRVAKKNGIGSLTLVDATGRFTEKVKDFAHEFVKEAYLSEEEKAAETKRLGLPKYLSVDERIVIKLKSEGKLFNSQKYSHNYPHCWRTDKPILYYPMDSWFIKVTAVKDRLVELNKTINWKPESTGTGRFGHWLENVQDWNLSRSRFWGTPLPIWRSENGETNICIGSIEELKREIDKANEVLKLNQTVPPDLHRPFIDSIILVSDNGEKLFKETDLIDVWFDSGAMPYAQWHYPFGTKELGADQFPADFIAEGVDQTRGWFYTLHAISTLVSDTISYKNVISNGLVLDKNGEKMSKRKGNVVDPFSTIEKYGADAPRWYMINNADPWDNLKFDIEGITEVRNKFFGTLFNTYNFFAIYANVDNFVYNENNLVDINKRPELDRWIISKLNSVIGEYKEFMDNYEPTSATRIIEKFVTDDLSNWHVRLSRRRFWKSEESQDKISAFQTLYHCLFNISKLIAPFSPFFAEWLYRNLTEHKESDSVHIQYLPQPDSSLIDKNLERRMNYAQRISSLILSLRKSQKIRVRQPLEKILITVLDKGFREDVEKVSELIKTEVNIKRVEYVDGENSLIKKKAKPNFRTLGKNLGKDMQQAAEIIIGFDQEQIRQIEKGEGVNIHIQDKTYSIKLEDIEIMSEDIPGWLAATDNEVSVALDITISEELYKEGLARELINRIQNLRKTRDFKVTDRIIVKIQSDYRLQATLDVFESVISTEVLADKIILTQTPQAEMLEIFDENDLSFTIELS